MANKYTRPLLNILGTFGLQKLWDYFGWGQAPKYEIEQQKPTPSLPPLEWQTQPTAAPQPTPPTPEPVAVPYSPPVFNPHKPVADKARLLKFGENTGLLIKPGEHGGIVVLLPVGYGAARLVRLEGPRGVLELTSTGFDNRHKGHEREHWRNRSVSPADLNRRLGREGQVYLVVDGVKVLVPGGLDERNE